MPVGGPLRARDAPGIVDLRTTGFGTTKPCLLDPEPESWLVTVVMARSDLIKATQHFGRWVSLASFAGLVVGVDVSCWIYLCLSTSAAAWAATGDYTTTVRLIMVPCVTAVAIDVRWRTRLAEDRDSVDSESTLTRAHRLVEDVGLVPKFRALRMPQGTRLSATHAAAPNQDIMWLGYRSLASLRGACKGADESKQACYWAFVCVAVNTATRTATNILACVCGCVAGFNDCAHAAALCLVLQSFPQSERLASGEVARRVVVPTTQYAKAWSGEGGTCVVDLSIPARFCPYKTSTRAHDPADHGSALSAIDVQPADLVRPGTTMFQHLTTSSLDAASPNFLAFIRHSRAAAARQHDMQQRRAERQRAKGRGRRAAPRGVRGQLAWDEYAGESEVEEGPDYIYMPEETLPP